MALLQGTTVGSFEIVAPLGEGGMGEVYRARDTKLNRDVALKILPDAFAADPDRLARFTREAQTLAALNHPNIAHIHGIEESAGIRALVMELVDGDDLAQRIACGPVRLDDALPIARQIAEALEAAHEQGIIHRDLKPANIKVKVDGTVKVLDFGLAKAMEPAAGPTQDVRGGRLQPDLTASPTIMSPAAMTGVGVILGTAGYMAPEQAKGKAVDKRADIWAFGVVLFEMLSGAPLFQGESVAETIGLVVAREPDWNRLPGPTPPTIRALLRRCLTRDPRTRLRDIGEARVVLERSPTDLDRQNPVVAVSAGHYRLAWIASLVIVGALASLTAWRLTRDDPIERPVRRFTIAAPKNARVISAAMSPDGRSLAFMSGDRIWLRKLDEIDSREVAGSEGAHAVFWSPDSAFVAFEARDQLWKASVSGGAPVSICRVPQAFSPASGLAWLNDGRIVFTTGGTGLLEVSAQGGNPRPVLDADAGKELDLHDAAALPDGRGVVFVPHLQGRGGWPVEVFDGRNRRRVFQASGRFISNPFYAPSGHILYEQEPGVWAVPFSLADLKATGEPFLVSASATQPTVSADGTLGMAPGASASDVQLAWVDRNGRIGTTLGRSGIAWSQPRLSPDGRHVAAVIASGNKDIWILELSNGSETRLTFEPEDDDRPVWSPDGKSIVYECGLALCTRPADGAGQRRVLVENAAAPAISPDGKSLVFIRPQPGTALDLWTLAISNGDLTAASTATPKPFLTAAGPQRYPEISPDGRYVAYESRTGSEWGIFVTRFPSGDGIWQISNVAIGSGGASARWSAKGDRLFFYNRLSDIVEVDVTTTPSFVAGIPRTAASGLEAGAMQPSGFDRSLDGNTFLIARSTAEPGSLSRVVVVENWVTERRR